MANREDMGRRRGTENGGEPLRGSSPCRLVTPPFIRFAHIMVGIAQWKSPPAMGNGWIGFGDGGVLNTNCGESQSPAATAPRLSADETL